jgi:hypothetical protein
LASRILRCDSVQIGSTHALGPADCGHARPVIRGQLDAAGVRSQPATSVSHRASVTSSETIRTTVSGASASIAGRPEPCDETRALPPAPSAAHGANGCGVDAHRVHHSHPVRECPVLSVGACAPAGPGDPAGDGPCTCPSSFEADYLTVELAKIYVGRSRH